MELGTLPSRESLVAAGRDIIWPSRSYCAESHVYNNVMGWGVAAIGFSIWGVDLLVHASPWGLACLGVAVTRLRGAYFCALARKW